MNPNHIALFHFDQFAEGLMLAAERLETTLGAASLLPAESRTDFRAIIAAAKTLACRASLRARATARSLGALGDDDAIGLGTDAADDEPVAADATTT